MSSSYGDNRGSVSFVDLCDSGPTGRAQNVARLQLIALCDADGNALPIAGLPCTDTFCTRKFDCTRDADAAIPFTLGTRQTTR